MVGADTYYRLDGNLLPAANAVGELTPERVRQIALLKSTRIRTFSLRSVACSNRTGMTLFRSSHSRMVPRVSAKAVALTRTSTTRALRSLRRKRASRHCCVPRLGSLCVNDTRLECQDRKSTRLN